MHAAVSPASRPRGDFDRGQQQAVCNSTSACYVQRLRQSPKNARGGNTRGSLSRGTCATGQSASRCGLAEFCGGECRVFGDVVLSWISCARLALEIQGESADFRKDCALAGAGPVFELGALEATDIQVSGAECRSICKFSRGIVAFDQPGALKSKSFERKFLSVIWNLKF